MKYVRTAYVITIENKVLKLCFSIIHTLSQDDMLSFEWWQWWHDSKLKIVHSTSVTNSKILKVLEQKMSLKLHLRLELKEKHCIGRVCTLICMLCYIGLQFILVPRFFDPQKSVNAGFSDARRTAQACLVTIPAQQHTIWNQKAATKPAVNLQQKLFILKLTTW